MNCYGIGAVTQAVVLQYTGLALPTGAPLEATFTMGNTDTVKKRLLLLIHNDTSDDLAAHPSEASRRSGAGKEGSPRATP